MLEILSPLLKKYGPWLVPILVLVGALIWWMAHNNAEPGEKVSLFWGMIDYTKGKQIFVARKQPPTHSSTTTTQAANELTIPPSAFRTQGGNEFILDTQGNLNGIPDRHDGAMGVDLTRYDLQFAFRNADGMHIQLWYKDSGWKNVYSWEYTINGEEPIRFNPFANGARNVDEFNDFTQIYAIGAKVREGLGNRGIQIASAKLIRRD